MYRASPLSHNLSSPAEPPQWDPDTQCMDSTQMWFCRDLWTDAAKEGIRKGPRGAHRKLKGHKRSLVEESEQMAEQPEHVVTDKRDTAGEEHRVIKRDMPKGHKVDAGAVDDDTGTDMDAMKEDAAHPAPGPLQPQDFLDSPFLIPNSEFNAARILVNPRCVTTYGGVSHTQLALDLFGTSSGEDHKHAASNYVLDDWAGPPDSFVCQEMRTTGGRTAPKSQRRVGFLLQNEVSPCCLDSGQVCSRMSANGRSGWAHYRDMQGVRRSFGRRVDGH